MSKKVRVLIGGEGDLATVTYQIGWQVSSANYLLHEDNLANALRSDPEIDVTRIWGPTIIDEFPNSLKDLENYDVLVLGDVGSDALRLTPQVMSGQKIVDRLKIIQEYVKEGGGFVMCGGYASFGGFRNTGRYHSTPIEDVLPVYIKDGDDRVEIVDGFHLKVVNRTHPVMANIRWDEDDFFLLGYNQVKAKPGARVLAKHGNDPIIVAWEYVKGRSIAFASDCELHWAGSFIQWSGYRKFVIQTIKWLAKKL
jgi:uncharacterized membrane protein